MNKVLSYLESAEVTATLKRECEKAEDGNLLLRLRFRCRLYAAPF